MKLVATAPAYWLRLRHATAIAFSNDVISTWFPVWAGWVSSPTSFVGVVAPVAARLAQRITMSIRAIQWAFDQEVFSSPQKFVLVAVSNFANDTGKTYPAAATIADITQQNVKTVRRALAKLVAQGFLEDTGKRYGDTQQVKVYQLPKEAWERYPKKGSLAMKDTQEESAKIPKKSPRRYPNQGSDPMNLEPVTLEKRERHARFVKPTLEEVKAYAREIELSDIEAEKFFYRNESVGWIVGKNPMKIWKAAMQTWKRNGADWNSKLPAGTVRGQRPPNRHASMDCGLSNEDFLSRVKMAK
jgi:hypothetical protein